MNKTFSKLAVAWLLLLFLTGTSMGQSCPELITNGDFGIVTNTTGNSQFCMGYVPGWGASHGSPQALGSPNFYAHMWNDGNAGEGITTNVTITSGKKYILTYKYRRSSISAATVDNIYVKLAQSSYSFPSTCNSGDPVPNPAIQQTISHITNISSTSWVTAQVCFTANNNYGKLFIYPENTTAIWTAHWADVDDISLVELNADAGPDQSTCGPVTIGPNCSIPGASYSWSPATGLSSATVRNPTASPSNPTTYTLTVTGPNGCTATDQVVVKQVCCPTAEFIVTAMPPCGLLFNSTSTLTSGTIVSQNWDFGDGSTGSGANVSHVYTYGGTYTVCLTVVAYSGGECCVRKVCQQVLVEPCPPQECNITANFNWQAINSCAYQYQFNGNFTAGPGITAEGWYWEFGDGTTGIGQNPSHTFPGPGNFNVCLTVIGSTPSGCCKGRYCFVVQVPQCGGGGGGGATLPQNGTQTQTDIGEAISIQPNPSEGTTTLQYDITDDSKVSVTLYNIQGQVIKTVLNSEPQKAGTHTVKLSGSDIAAGTYICKVQINDKVHTERVVIIK